MKIKNFTILVILLISTLFVAACGSIQPPGGEELTPIPTVISDVEIVSEGRIVPNDSVTLAFFASGQVDEVLVEEGDLVAAGDIVARLGDRDQIEASIAGAEAELLAAQQALDELYDNNDIAKANAFDAIPAAEKVLRDAQYTLDNYTIPSVQEGLSATEAVKVLKDKLDQARQAFEPYKYFSSGNETRKDLKEDLDEAQADYNNAVKRLQYETNVDTAQAKLDKAWKDFETIQDGPDPDDVEALEARITAAQANLEAARASLDNLDLLATIDGTVVDQNLILGQNVTAGTPVMTIADFSQMYAETDDLTEIEVVDVALGQEVTVVADALPDVEMTGTVEEISELFEEKRGDITYTARILLDDFDLRLRWGMTVVITFKE